MALSARTVKVARVEPEKSCSVAVGPVPDGPTRAVAASPTSVRAGLNPATHG